MIRCKITEKIDLINVYNFVSQHKLPLLSTFLSLLISDERIWTKNLTRNSLNFCLFWFCIIFFLLHFWFLDAIWTIYLFLFQIKTRNNFYEKVILNFSFLLKNCHFLKEFSTNIFRTQKQFWINKFHELFVFRNMYLAYLNLFIWFLSNFPPIRTSEIDVWVA